MNTATIEQQIVKNFVDKSCPYIDFICIFAYRILKEEADIDILKIAEEKVKYLKRQI